jgi:MoaA/NifB/PqqE/SkfB family radical SAM enzyme
MMPDLRQATTEYTAMSFLRASVSDICNLNCIYCPKSAGMENYAPASLRGHRLTVDAFCHALEALAGLGFQGLCITGGEPTTNPALPEIMERSRPHFDVLELTSNGFKLSDVLPRIAHLVDRVKISIDSADQSEAEHIAQSRRDPLAPALQSLLECLDTGVTVTVKTVVMRRNLHELPVLDRDAYEDCRSIPAPTVAQSLRRLLYTDTPRYVGARVCADIRPTSVSERVSWRSVPADPWVCRLLAAFEVGGLC